MDFKQHAQPVIIVEQIMPLDVGVGPKERVCHAPHAQQHNTLQGVGGSIPEHASAVQDVQLAKPFQVAPALVYHALIAQLEQQALVVSPRHVLHVLKENTAVGLLDPAPHAPLEPSVVVLQALAHLAVLEHTALMA
jgi:hypothetical protein